MGNRYCERGEIAAVSCEGRARESGITDAGTEFTPFFRSGARLNCCHRRFA